MESCHLPLGQSWPWEPLERRMRLICVFYVFPNQCLTQETRWGAEEGHKLGGRVCEILLWLWLCASSGCVVIESLAAAAAGAGRGFEHRDGSCSLAASSAQRLSMETDLYVGKGKRKLLCISMGDRWHGVKLSECNYTQWVSGRHENPSGLWLTLLLPFSSHLLCTFKTYLKILLEPLGSRTFNFLWQAEFWPSFFPNLK